MSFFRNNLGFTLLKKNPQILIMIGGLFLIIIAIVIVLHSTVKEVMHVKEEKTQRGVFSDEIEKIANSNPNFLLNHDENPLDTLMASTNNIKNESINKKVQKIELVKQVDSKTGQEIIKPVEAQYNLTMASDYENGVSIGEMTTTEMVVKPLGENVKNKEFEVKGNKLFAKNIYEETDILRQVVQME